ncbi:MAG TPA: hypothetical protein VFY93_16125 [Planctomycetota bacterium]|nr:hypothetical protein [Planctomycetota bacterium]
MLRSASLALLALALPAAADDGLRTWKDEIRKLERAEQKFWGEYQKRYIEALLTLDKPATDAASRPNDAVNYVLDYSGLRALYADHVLIEETKGKADLAFAASGDPKALPELFDALMALGKRIDDVDADLVSARPQQQGTRYDQRPGIERHGLALRIDALERAIAQCPGAAAFLGGDGMKTAAKRDGKRSIVRRVAVLDTLGLCAGDDAVAGLAPYAAAPESSLRIAAAEALLRHGPAARPALAPLFEDRSAAVRRALLQGIAAGGAGDPLWIEPVLGAYRTAVGVVRGDCVRALAALTNQKFGDAPTAWQEWFSDYKAEIDGGKFRKEQIEVREATPKPVPSTCVFYGIPATATRVVLVFEGSRRIFWPADLATLLKQYKETWHRTRRAWEDTNPSQLATLLEEFDRTCATFTPDVTFGALAIYAACDTEPLGSPKLMHPEKRDVRAVRHDLERLPGDGWCSQYEGLTAAAALLGMGPESDADFPDPQDGAIFLWDAGGPQGGRFMTPEAAIAAFQRFNRFRRLVVNTVRICDEGEPADILMKGLAEATGGTYVWAKKPRTGPG